MGEAIPLLDRGVLAYRFDKAIPPRLTVRPGESLRVETHDARSGELRKPEDVIPTAPALGERYPRTNPATGPIRVEGAEPGDALSVTILDIALDPLGFIIARPEWGTVRGVPDGQMARMLPVRDGHVHFGALRLPVRPNVGVLATAPAGEAVSTLQMGRFGGNMDCNAVRVGVTVHLPVFVPGALLFVGDVHATMGDAEPVGTGCEIGATVTLRVDLVRGGARDWPWLESDDLLVGIGAAPDFAGAAETAMRGTMELVAERTGLSTLDAFLLLGLVGDVRVNQACNAPIDVGARVEVPKACLAPSPPG